MKWSIQAKFVDKGHTLWLPEVLWLDVGTNKRAMTHYSFYYRSDALRYIKNILKAKLPKQSYRVVKLS